MDSITYHKFIDWLILRFEVYARKRKGEIIKFAKINSSENIEEEEKPFYSLRNLFFPPQEKLYQYQDKKFILGKGKTKKQVIFGIPLFDLEALTQYTAIFARDPYFQASLRNMIIIGQSPVPDENSFFQKFEESILRHRKFDIYIDQNDGTYRLFTGSEDGQKILEDFGETNYEHIEYQGAVPPKISRHWLEIKEKIKNSQGSQFWKDLGKKCLACGKCVLVCPTCYCYDLKTNAQGVVSREWGNCFYSDFSEVAGKYKFLKNIGERLYNWYDHKFVRMPEEYGFVGCVQCGRCIDVCPVGINIKKNLEKI